MVTKVSQLISGLVACFRELLFRTLLTLSDMSGTSLEDSARFGALSPNQTHFFLLFSLFQTNFRLGQQGRGVSMRFRTHLSLPVVPADLPHQEAG